jgi:hypothetical protein
VSMRLPLVTVVVLGVIGVGGCAPTTGVEEAPSARVLAVGPEGERLVVADASSGAASGLYSWGEDVYLVSPDGEKQRLLTESAIFSYVVGGVISGEYVVWVTDDYDYPQDGAVHLTFYERGTGGVRAWNYEVDTDLFPRGLYVDPSEMILCGDALFWSGGWGDSDATYQLAVDGVARKISRPFDAAEITTSGCLVMEPTAAG